jgi:TolB-like protein
MRLVTTIACLFGLVLLSGATRAGTPTTRPAGVRGDVYLTPFAFVGGDNHLDWAGKAVQQNLMTDLARSRMHPVTIDQALSTADAQTAAKSAGAKYLITGSYQVSDSVLRFNGQIVNVASGSVVGGISATGPERDLFAMEDAMSAQAIQQLIHMPGIVGINNFKPTAPLPTALQPAALQQMIQPPAATAGSSYEGSGLQAYVNNNLTPSTDFNQQLQDSMDRLTYSPVTAYLPYDGIGYGYPSFYGTFGGAYGGFGISYSFGRYGYGFRGGSGFHHGGFGGGFGGGGFGGGGFGGGHGHR